MTMYRKLTHTNSLLDESSYKPTSQKTHFKTIKDYNYRLMKQVQLVSDTPYSLCNEKKYLEHVFHSQEQLQCWLYLMKHSLTYQRWYTNLEQMSLNRCQQLPVSYKQLSTLYNYQYLTYYPISFVSSGNSVISPVPILMLSRCRGLHSFRKKIKINIVFVGMGEMFPWSLGIEFRILMQGSKLRRTGCQCNQKLETRY